MPNNRSITINDTTFTCNHDPSAAHEVRWRWTATGPWANLAPDVAFASFGKARAALYANIAGGEGQRRRVVIAKTVADAVNLAQTAESRGIILEKFSERAFRAVGHDHVFLAIANEIEALGGKQNVRSAERIRKIINGAAQ
jgi:hypothetical protein